MADILDPMHPGEVLDELYLRPLKMSAGALAKNLGVPRTRVERIVKGRTSITPDTAFRLAKAFPDNAALLDEYADELRSCPGRRNSRCL